ncbi:PREDICTED: benzyl alcohol O-benzoyltransferase-like [Ipomoea nil]|uniref:benzyl alcohol O-benzoyltransferase-like n=1 Tax=Ipomoea nil TaxID=35883 RepID=UPI000901FC8A|nr:PREDICTED: benzyl alcohol O-benzoyltransferase-like [Ipomoea nil]
MALAPLPQPLAFTVRRWPPQLVPPAEPTPREIKQLSDIDDQEGLRSHIPNIFFYPKSSSMEGVDPAKFIRAAIAKALVFYYPLAGRLREGAGRKLSVDCTGEGVMFTEADADVPLDAFGDALHPPIPRLDELIYPVGGSEEFLNFPLLLFQVTRLRCGGFIFTVSLNHVVSDSPGLIKFLNTVVEMARGATSPSVLPVWKRELFSARDPPRVTCKHPEYDDVLPQSKAITTPSDNIMLHRAFFFGPAHLSSLRSSLPPHLRNRSTFEVLTAFLWRCRTMALGYHPDDEVRALCIVNLRSRKTTGLSGSSIPPGYYGNALAHVAARTTAGELTRNPLGYAVELIMKVKGVVCEEYMKSLADFLVIKGRPSYNMTRTYLVSDVTRAGLGELDFGWGKPRYAGPAKGTVAAFHIRYKNRTGEEGIVVPIRLPAIAMDKFAKEIKKLEGDESLVKSSL